ncbi:expressed unknown protein [Seminavis robusta]|uniref:Uncharacterized protein n=1 Tax=Seminavis robusta TaxID=568900 RepID=A0A9N8HHT8_9STRA|nr:expressed unknown protein [Seminavis robusta]|eukprot:Sro463_g148300.1 n/a (121) ;mRNA; f:56860-57382
MVKSFSYPEHLLHQVVEPQWFPKPRAETESLLDALEAAEEAQVESLRRIAQKEAPDPIGAAAAATNGQPPPQAVVGDVAYGSGTDPPARTRFWNQVRAPSRSGSSTPASAVGSPSPGAHY